MKEKELKKILSLSFSERLKRYDKRAHVLKRYIIEKWGSMPCPLRLVVNSYVGCELKCAYCYVWCNKIGVLKRKNFRKNLIKDIERYKIFQLEKLAVEISPSTDPLQYIEGEEGETLFAVTNLIDAGFKVLIVTKNPGMLFNKKYENIIKNKNVSLDVTITSLGEKRLEGKFLSNFGPSPEKKLKDMGELIKRGITVRLRIDPILPSIDGCNEAQTDENLRELVRSASKIGVKLIISKTMRLNDEMPGAIKEKYMEYYKESGLLFGGNYILSKKERKGLLQPIYEECKKECISFCPCCDVDVFENEEMVTCNILDETKLLNREVSNN